MIKCYCIAYVNGKPYVGYYISAETMDEVMLQSEMLMATRLSFVDYQYIKYEVTV